MNLQEMYNSVSNHLPETGMSAGAIVLCLIVLKLFRGKLRLVLLLVALGLLAGGIWWYRQHR